MEQLGTLPSAEAVLDKLKSDGTFDQFRKTCSAAIEAEVSVDHRHQRLATPANTGHYSCLLDVGFYGSIIII